MLRLRCVMPFLRRRLHVGWANRDQVLEQLRVCSVEDQVFDVVGKNKTKLTVDHVSCAVRMLWQFQKELPQLLRTTDQTKIHQQFLTLKVLAENKIELMDDLILIDMLYAFLRMEVDPHDTLIQQLVSEAWLRLDRLPLSSLSKLAICLRDQQLQHSPLMGQITHIMDQRLPSIDDARVLMALMISTFSLVSPRLRDALISRADHLLSTIHPLNNNIPRRIVQFLRNSRFIHRPLLEKCNEIFLKNISGMNVDDITIILWHYQSLQFNNCDFRLVAEQRLIELIETSTDTISFSKLFVSLVPMASLEIREGFVLLFVIGSKNLHVYKRVEIARITQALALLQYHNPDFLNTLRDILSFCCRFLQKSFLPYELTMLVRVLSLLPSPRLEDGALTRIESVVGQCDVYELNTIAIAVSKWVHRDTSHRLNTPSKYVRLLQTLNRCGHDRLQTANKLDALLDELKFNSGEWFEEMLLEETMVTLQRMIDQISWTNVPELASFFTRTNFLCPPLMDRIASEAIENMDKIHHSATYATLLPFSLLNYDTAQVDELYDACIKRSFDPHLLVFLAYFLAVTARFPEELIRKIFSIDFLRKLDSQLETLLDHRNMRTRLRLMQLNRAVCLECPEYQVPWFHERYCQQLHKKGNRQVSPLQQQIHKMLGEVFGGINCVQVAVVTPYFYTVDFECKLDKHMQPLGYSEPSTLQMSERKNDHWDSSLLENTRDELPPGAQRVAVDFLDSKSFCKNSHHMKGEVLMRKRHLEILGYRVVQIPHFEWNSMELSTHDAWKAYLKKKILS
uniref:RAP domain-containing protein n=1 Tax=Gouania willdenowi TaxID=441366 RepID=A0A8C5I8A9_GOUWI